MAKARATTSSRLSVDDWIQAGYAILAEEGTKALKIDRLCSRLGVTKGSFYWHFTVMAGYRAALVEAWGELRDDPGAALHDADTYRWPMVPALALLAAMPALGSAERVADIYAERLSKRVLAYEGVTQKDKPIAQAHLGQARVRLRALRGLLADTVGQIETIVAAGDPVPRPVRGEARLAAAHIVHESRAVIGGLLEASGASAHFIDNPLQRIKRDVDVLAGHVVFDYDTSRELAGALMLGMKVPRTAMV